MTTLRHLIPVVDLQRWLPKLMPTLPTLPLDGVYGPKTELLVSTVCRDLVNAGTIRASSSDWSPQRKLTAIEQHILELAVPIDLGAIDGLPGPRTDYAVTRYHEVSRDLDLPSPLPPRISLVRPATSPPVFPRQRDMRSYFGLPGSDDCRALTPSLYPLRMDGSLSATARIPLTSPGAPRPITRIALHRRLHPSFQAIQRDVLSHYGHPSIVELGLDQYAGSYNFRPMRGGTNLSMHSWGAAIDWDAQRNGLHVREPLAFMSGPRYRAFINIHYDHGWISLGRERGFDWMHMQAPRL